MPDEQETNNDTSAEAPVSGEASLDLTEAIETNLGGPTGPPITVFGRPYHFVSENQIRGLTRARHHNTLFSNLAYTGTGAILTAVIALLSTNLDTTPFAVLLTLLIALAVVTPFLFCVHRDFESEVKERIEEMKSPEGAT